jgi:hypothetical protein
VIAELPAPLVPAEVDLRDFSWMPVEIHRLRRSKAWLVCKRRPELAFYMLNLWTAAWHDTPAASLEDDDDMLADLAMCDPAKWAKVREQALRGWVKCADGRLYHPVVADLANSAWAQKQAQRQRTEKARLAREQNRLQHQQQRGTNATTENATASVARYVTEQRLNPTEQTGTDRRGTGDSEEEERVEAGAAVARAEAKRDGIKPTPAGTVCGAMRRAGYPTTNPGDPLLLTLLEQGATEAEFVDSAEAALRSTPAKGWGWILSRVQKRRAEAAAIALAPKPADDRAWRKTDLGIRAMAQQLGVKSRPDESFEAWDRRVFTAWQRAGEPAPQEATTA